jgi:hypothetical protein
MDIDRLARRVSEQLAARPSRRSSISTAAKLAAGAGAVLAGLRGASEASAQIASSCCDGARACTSADSCERGTKVRYSWYCGSGTERYLCQDCNKGKRNICVIATRA